MREATREELLERIKELEALNKRDMLERARLTAEVGWWKNKCESILRGDK